MTERPNPTAGDLFADALKISAAQRAGWLDEHCADPAVRAEVDSLLASHDKAGDFLLNPVVDTDQYGDEALELEDLSGGSVGRFRLVRVLGRGGMSAVYLGKRTEGDFAQEVAVKVIRRGMDSGPILRRFHTERRALASLEHPNIARLIDGGATDDGRPYLVMEYVDGLPIDRYCEQRQLSIAARLDLFRGVCEAVQHAHGRLVVHRDLKPSNILIGDDGRVKLLDFGIAKLLQPSDETDMPGLTVTVQRMMTPRYASPEQVRGESITTATDIYSLGVLLYELLTDKPPYRLERTSSREVERVICVTEPARPSTVVAPGSRLARSLAGDLDNIVLKAMRKEPERRYISAEHFAEDLRRHTEGRPVRARPDTLGYRAGKFLHRNLVAVIAASVVVLALVGATAISSRLYLQSEQARQEAEIQRLTAARISDFLQSMMVAVDPVAMQSGEPVTVDRILAEAAGRIDTELASEPEVAAALHGTIANTYQNLGLFDRAEPHGRAQFALWSEVRGPESLAALKAQLLLGRILLDGGEAAEAEAQFLAVLDATAAHAETGSSLSADALRELGRVADNAGDYELAGQYLGRAIALRRNLGPEQQEPLAMDLNQFGLSLVRSGLPDSAAAALREALQLMESVRDEDHTFIGQIANNIGWALGENGDWSEATGYFEQAIARYEGVFDADHPNVLAARTNLARARQLSGDLAGAEEMYREVIAATRSRFGEKHEYVAHGLNNFALMLEEERQDYAGAAKLFGEALDIYRASKGVDHPWSAIAGYNNARVLRRGGDLATAEIRCREALTVRRRVLREGHPDIARSEFQLGGILMDYDDAAGAEPHLASALAIRQEALPEGHATTANNELQFGLCLLKLNRAEEARSHLERARTALEAANGAQDTGTLRAAEALAELDRAGR